MFNEADYNFLYSLSLNKSAQWSQVPESIRRSSHFKTLLECGILQKERAGRGYLITVIDSKIFEDFFRSTFPNVDDQQISKISNVAKFKDSKRRKTASNNVVLFRGYHLAAINGVQVDLQYYTDNFGLFATKLEKVQTSKICFVENLDVFLSVEQIINTDYIYFHSYGRLGQQIISQIDAQDILVFSDYDFVGLKEYLDIKEVHPQTQFFMPQDYNEKFRKYAKPLKDKNHKQGQTASKKVQDSEDIVVVEIREQLFKNHKFLEQQALFIHD
jgi:hypothetical protein